MRAQPPAPNGRLVLQPCKSLLARPGYRGKEDIIASILQNTNKCRCDSRLFCKISVKSMNYDVKRAPLALTGTTLGTNLIRLTCIDVKRSTSSFPTVGSDGLLGSRHERRLHGQPRPERGHDKSIGRRLANQARAQEHLSGLHYVYKASRRSRKLESCQVSMGCGRHAPRPRSPTAECT